jgi:hypothetical protein
VQVCCVEDRADTGAVSLGPLEVLVHHAPRIGHQRGEHLLWYEAPALDADCMREHGGRGHSPRPLCARCDVRIDGSCIAHVVDAPAEEGLHRGAEVEGDHAGCHGAHARRLHSGCWGLVGVLAAIGRGIAAGAIAAGRDSSAGTGAGRHCIAWERANVCGGTGGCRGRRF